MTSIIKAPKAYTPPPTPVTPVMPTQDDEAVQLAKRKKRAEVQARSGRLSTILTSNTNTDAKLGGY